MNLYCVMVPTHRNPSGGLFDFKWRRRFSRRHDEAMMINVAILHGGYAFLTRSEGGCMNGVDHFQVEGMRPFLRHSGIAQTCDRSILRTMFSAVTTDPE